MPACDERPHALMAMLNHLPEPLAFNPLDAIECSCGFGAKCLHGSKLFAIALANSLQLRLILFYEIDIVPRLLVCDCLCSLTTQYIAIDIPVAIAITAAIADATVFVCSPSNVTESSSRVCNLHTDE